LYIYPFIIITGTKKSLKKIEIKNYKHKRKKMSLNDHCISLGIAELNPEVCQQYLETPTNGQNDDNTTVDLPLIEFSVINELTGYIKTNIDEIAKNRENIADIKRIAACALSNAINSKDYNGIIHHRSLNYTFITFLYFYIFYSKSIRVQVIIMPLQYERSTIVWCIQYKQCNHNCKYLI